MFSTKAQLIKKTGKHGIGRFSFLEQLVKEYKATNTLGKITFLCEKNSLLFIF